jgi:hypothetical protein
MNSNADAQKDAFRWRVVLFVALAGGILVRWLLFARTGFTIGDAFIGFRFGEQFAAGHGLVFNPGERVGGNTSPLYTLFLGLGGWMGISVSLFARLFGILCDVAVFLLMMAVLHAVRGVRSISLRTAIVATMFLCPFLFLYSVSGMETPLYMLLIFLLVWRTLKKLDWIYFLSALLLVFCRPDAIVAIAASLLFLVLSTRKIPWRASVGVFVIGLVYLGFNYWCYQTVIPPTVAVKSVAYHNTVMENLLFIASRFFFRRLWILAVYVFLACALTVTYWKNPVVLLSGIMTTAYLMFLAFSPTLRSWYLVPFVTFSAFTILTALATAVENRNVHIPDAAVLGALAVYTLAACYGYKLVFHEGRVWRGLTRDLAERAGTWLRDNTPSDARVFVTALETAYFSDRYTVDYPGLVCPAVLQMIKSNPKMELLEMADRLKVDYALVPDDAYKKVPPNFRLVKVFRMEMEAHQMGLVGQTSVSLYQRQP